MIANIVRDAFLPINKVTLFHGDRLNLLQEMGKHGARVNLVVTSPPYNIGKSYEEKIPFDDYLSQQEETIRACVSLLDETGSICWQVGNYISGTGKSKEVYPLDIIFYGIFKKLGLRLKNRIVWHFGHGLHETSRFSGRHETILWFTKDQTDYTFNLDAIRVPQKYPGKRSYRGANKGKPSGNPNGKNPSDVWEIPNVKANHIEKTIHDCQFPVALAQRLILALTNPGDLVLDPYIGVCSTAVAAVLSDRRVCGSDTSADYLAIGKDRINRAANGSLTIRPLNMPIFSPDPNTTVASIPVEWEAIQSEDGFATRV